MKKDSVDPCKEISKFITITPEELSKKKWEFDNFCDKEIFKLRREILDESDHNKVSDKLGSCTRTLYKHLEDNYPRGSRGTDEMFMNDCGGISLPFLDNEEYIWMAVMEIYLRNDQLINIARSCLYKEKYISRIDETK